LRVFFVENESIEQTINQSIPREPVSVWRGIRRREFFTLFWTLGLLNIGWLVLFVAWRRRKSVGLGSHILCLVAASLACWLILMFGPGITVPHLGPYAT